MFRYQSGWLVNEHGKVMDVHGGRDDENRDIIVWKKHNGLNQQWDIIHADKWKRDPKKGELNEDFGLYVERDFYIISELSRHRYLDALNRNFVIKTKNGRTSQRWWFDQRSLTIKSRQYNQSWNILGNGGQQNINVSGTNSKWW
jgi:hypothetical protein